MLQGAASPRLVADATPPEAAGGKEAPAGCRAEKWARSGLEGLPGVEKKEVSGDRQLRTVVARVASAMGVGSRVSVVSGDRDADSQRQGGGLSGWTPLRVKSACQTRAVGLDCSGQPGDTIGRVEICRLHGASEARVSSW